jgi:hypothetical protein
MPVLTNARGIRAGAGLHIGGGMSQRGLVIGGAPLTATLLHTDYQQLPRRFVADERLAIFLPFWGHRPRSHLLLRERNARVAPRAVT